MGLSGGVGGLACPRMWVGGLASTGGRALVVYGGGGIGGGGGSGGHCVPTHLSLHLQVFPRQALATLLAVLGAGLSAAGSLDAALASELQAAPAAAAAEVQYFFLTSTPPSAQLPYTLAGAIPVHAAWPERAPGRQCGSVAAAPLVRRLHSGLEQRREGLLERRGKVRGGVILGPENALR